MKRLLQLKHWQIFSFLVGMPLLFQFVLAGLLTSGRNPNTFSPLLLAGFALILLLAGACFFGWFYALGTGLHQKLPATVRMNIRLFKAALCTPLVYMALLFLFMAWKAFSAPGAQAFPDAGIVVLIVPLHLLSMAGIFYCLRFNAKALKAVELQRPAVFSDYLGELFMIWFFPIGIWVIQPRVDQLFNAPDPGYSARV